MLGTEKEVSDLEKLCAVTALVCSLGCPCIRVELCFVDWFFCPTPYFTTLEDQPVLAGVLLGQCEYRIMLPGVFSFVLDLI